MGQYCVEGDRMVKLCDLLTGVLSLGSVVVDRP